MAEFRSSFKSLRLQDEEGTWAKFVDGKFSTSDPKVAARLRKAADVEEVVSEKPKSSKK